MKTLAPAARVWSPGALVLEAARRGAGFGAAARGRGAAARADPRGDRPAESGSRTSSPWHAEAAGAGVLTSAQGSRALQAGSLATAAPQHQASARVRPPGSLPVGASTGFRQTRPRQMLAGKPLARPPARRLARPPTLAPPALAPPAPPPVPPPRRPQLRPPPGPPPGARAHGLGRSRRRWHRGASSLHRTPLRLLPFPAPPLAAGAPSTPERCSGCGEAAGEGRREGAREYPDREPTGAGTARGEQRCLSAPRPGGQLLGARGGEGHSGARGLGWC